MATIKEIAGDRTMVDGNSTLEITIEPCDIAGSKAHNQTQCAIARAVKRQFEVEECYVLRSTVWLDDGERLVRYALPGSLQKEIVSFDRNKDFRPGVYHLAKKTHDKADAVRALDRARTRVHVAGNNLTCAKADVAHARSNLTRCREDEAAARRALREAERHVGAGSRGG